MIFDAIVTVLGQVLVWLGEAFGTVPTPGFVASMGTQLGVLAGYASGVGQFVPLSDAVTASTFVLSCVGLGFAIKVIRIVASFFTAGGGSAA